MEIQPLAKARDKANRSLWRRCRKPGSLGRGRASRIELAGEIVAVDSAPEPRPGRTLAERRANLHEYRARVRGRWLRIRQCLASPWPAAKSVPAIRTPKPGKMSIAVSEPTAGSSHKGK